MREGERKKEFLGKKKGGKKKGLSIFLRDVQGESTAERIKRGKEEKGAKSIGC